MSPERTYCSPPHASIRMVWRVEVGAAYSFIIHRNGDVRVALGYNGNYAHYVHDSSQTWSNGWTLRDSGLPDHGGTLTAVNDVPYLVHLSENTIMVRKEFEDPIEVAPASPSSVWVSVGIRWSFYNHNAPGIIDISAKSRWGYVDNYYWHANLSTAVGAVFEADRSTGVGPLTVRFADWSSSFPDVGIVSWAWDFNNDGVTDSTEQNPTFTYGESGTYSVSLTVTDSLGITDTTTLRDYIEVMTDSDANSIADPLDNCPSVCNPNQRDLDSDGIGDLCGNLQDLIGQALYSTGLRSETVNDIAASDVTAVLKDGSSDQATRVQKVIRVYDVLSIRADVEPALLASLILRLNVKALYDSTPQSARIYAYNSDGVSDRFPRCNSR